MIKLIARLLTSFPSLTDRLLAYAKKTPYMHLDGYMNRWWLFNPVDMATSRRKYNWIPFSVRFHEILRPDDDRALHSHPWRAKSIILKGWYDEVRENPEFESMLPEHSGNAQYYEVTRYPGDVVSLAHNEVHRIVATSSTPVLTLFFTFKYMGTWGFKVNGVIVPWREYLARKEQK